MTKKILFTGGGTGGHVSPNIAISQGLQKRYPEAQFHYVGKKGKSEESMIPKAWKDLFDAGRAKLSFVSTTSGSVKKPSVLLQLGLGFVQACALLLTQRPDMIIATGGYVSAPILIAGGVLKKLRLIKSKIMLHEANAELGKMNRIAIRFADRVAYSFPGTELPADKSRFVGYPVREHIVSSVGVRTDEDRRVAREVLGLPKDAKVIFAFGGSQGARTINRGIVDALPMLLSDPDVIVILGTGKQNSSVYSGKQDVEERFKNLASKLPEDANERFIQLEFIDNMGQYYAATDLVVCRGGAGSLVEICANGLPSICIPKVGAGDHQAVNGRVLERLGATRVIFESKDPLRPANDPTNVECIDANVFATVALELLANPESMKRMGEIAATQYDVETTNKCADLVQYLMGDSSNEPQLREEPELPEETILGKGLLGVIAYVRRHRTSSNLTDEERRMVFYKIDNAAAANNFVDPARACRLIGWGRFGERRQLLERFAVDNSKSPFTRRDAFVGLRLLEEVDSDVVSVCLKGFDDSYFETVNEAAYALFSLLNRERIGNTESFSSLVSQHGTEIFKKAQTLANSKEFDIRMNGLALLALTSSDFSSVEPFFQRNYFHPSWQVRKKIVECFALLIERGLVDRERIREILTFEFLQTSNGFAVEFQLKGEIKKVFNSAQSSHT